MYERLDNLVLATSASALPHNLDVRPENRGSLAFAFVHKSIVNVVGTPASRVADIRRHGFGSASVGGAGGAAAAGDPDADDDDGVRQQQILVKDPAAQDSNANVTQAKWVNLHGRSLLVAASSAGVEIFESKGQTGVFWHPIPKPTSNEAKSSFARGITTLGERLVCVGTSDGSILCFEIPDQGSDVQLFQSLQGHAAPIADLTSSGANLVSVDDDGDVVLWRLTKERSVVHEKRLKEIGTPTAVRIYEDLLVTAHGTGHIRIYKLPSLRLSCEVTAHARWINALDVAHKAGMLLSASEDSFVRIWQLNPSSSPPIEHVFCHKMSDVPLTGAKFCDADGRSFALLGFDFKTLFLFSS